MSITRVDRWWATVSARVSDRVRKKAEASVA
jgi:hypothetical protein